MPGRICKEIIDNGNALIQAVSCMQASVGLGHVEGQYAPYDLVEAFEKAAKQAALSAQNVSNSINLGSAEKGAAARAALDSVAPPGDGKA